MSKKIERDGNSLTEARKVFVAGIVGCALIENPDMTIEELCDVFIGLMGENFTACNNNNISKKWKEVKMENALTLKQVSQTSVMERIISGEPI